MTGELTNDEVDFETAVGDPAAFYADPNAIIADTTLSKSQKHRFLSGWAQDLAGRQIADAEGMAPDAAASARDAALLKSINAALEQMETVPDSDPVAAVRTLWIRLRKLIG